MSHPPCAPAPLQQPLAARSPPWLLFILAQKSFGGMVGGGRGQLLSLRQKDAGQHFICNHLNVLAVFRIQNPCWGVPGRWGKKSFHLSGRLRGKGRLSRSSC